MLANPPIALKSKSHPLVISPNLDALLEHEEQARNRAVSHPHTRLSPDSLEDITGKANFPVGLPPPPRGKRRPKSPKSPRSPARDRTEKGVSPTRSNFSGVDDGNQPSVVLAMSERALVMVENVTGSSSSTNPYINPAPTLDNVGGGKELEAKPRLGEGQVDVCDGGGRPSCLAETLEKRPQATSQRSHLRAVSCRNIGDLFTDSMPDQNHKNISSRSGPVRHLKRKPKPSKVQKSQHGIGAMAYPIDDGVVLDIRRRYSNDFIDITNDANNARDDAWRHRPLNSHAPSRRGSNSSGSTIGPCNTAPVPNLSTAVQNFQNLQDPDTHSFIDFLSPTATYFPPPSLATSDMLLSRTNSNSPNATAPDKQPSSSHPSKPSTPKPIFSLPTSFRPSQVRSTSRSSSPHQASSDKREELPPTTNFLDMGERADLVKKSRKLTRLFGETPTGDTLSPQEFSRSTPTSHESTTTRKKRSKQAASPNAPVPFDSGRHHLHATARRHSIPVTPDELSESFNQVLFQSTTYRARLGLTGEPLSDDAGHFADVPNKLGSRISFIDLSDEEDEVVSPITFAPNPHDISFHRPPSPSQLSLYEAMTPEQRAEEQKRRKREKLAKLHRFLGSRVPTDLVLGVEHLEPSLPPIQSVIMSSEESESRKQWLRRRRSSSAGALPSWSDDIDRLKEDLNDKEKAINVRRAQKMEKMFGVAPPQTLYHTRHSPSPSVPTEIYLKRSKSPPRPSFGGFIPPGEVPSPTYQQRNPNRSSYIKQRPKKNDRPNTAESSRRLLPEGQDCYNYDELPALHQSGTRPSLVYHHYQHSLKSLGDILDRDDKESLAELHQYLNDYEGNNVSSPPLRETPLTKDRRLSNASSIKSERRRSLPARTSMMSIASEYSVASMTAPKPELSEFQIRRRRAAKLTQFFGVNYRELINDVLESLETGLEHERKRGTLRAEELEDLLERLRKIKTNRKGFF